jgi:flagellar protein FliS
MIVEKLLDSFRQVSEMDESEAVMENTETIYAGLTYGRDSLNETLYSENMANRGFMA